MNEFDHAKLERKEDRNDLKEGRARKKDQLENHRLAEKDRKYSVINRIRFGVDGKFKHFVDAEDPGYGIIDNFWLFKEKNADYQNQE